MTVGDSAHALVLQTLLLEAIQQAEMAIVVYDEEGRYVTVNDCACEILGYTREELLAHDVGDFTDGIDRSRLLTNKRREGVRLVQRRDGSTVPVAFVVVPTTVGKLPYSSPPGGCSTTTIHARRTPTERVPRWGAQDPASRRLASARSRVLRGHGARSPRLESERRTGPVDPR
jgi:PAS domain S-box-containing protein